ncbi:MAG: DNA cytosine methyltransferase, partial [Candidatus Adiutrix sp.]
FSGCGGFDYGATQAGVNIIWANDINRVAASAYRSIFSDTEFVHGDVQNIAHFPAADILIGCYPCTGFSLAARRRWKQRTERDLLAIEGNFLFKEFLRVLKQTQPKYFFVENVRGMLTAKNGWFFEQQLSGFKEHGYVVAHQCLHGQNFGLPQTRQRVFIVGTREDIAKNFKYTFPTPTHGPETQVNYKTLRETIGGLPLWPEGEFFQRNFHGHYLTRNRKRGWDDLSYTIVANASHVPLHPEGLPMTYISTDNWALQGDFNRRLSWRECALIQGLPLKIEPQGRLEDLYTVVGNAVPPPFGEALLKPIVRHEQA